MVSVFQTTSTKSPLPTAAHRLTSVTFNGKELVRYGYDGITAEAALTYLHVLTDDGVMLQKMAAVRKMYEGYQGFALVKLANLPLLDKLADRLYPWFARHRYQFPKWLLPRPECEGGVCRIPPKERTKK